MQFFWLYGWNEYQLKTIKGYLPLKTKIKPIRQWEKKNFFFLIFSYVLSLISGYCLCEYPSSYLNRISFVRIKRFIRNPLDCFWSTEVNISSRGVFNNYSFPNFIQSIPKVVNYPVASPLCLSPTHFFLCCVLSSICSLSLPDTLFDGPPLINFHFICNLIKH